MTSAPAFLDPETAHAAEPSSAFRDDPQVITRPSDSPSVPEMSMMGQNNADSGLMDLNRLRLLTIVVPIAFLVALEALSLFALRLWLPGTVPRLLVIFGILALGVVPFAFWVFRVIERQQRDLAASAVRLHEWNQELETKVAERTRQIQEYSKELTRRVLEAQEDERKRIARELHDETAQSLSTLLINIDLLELQLTPSETRLQSGLERLRTLAKRTLDETRALSHDLRPTILDDVGLVAAIQWFADEWGQSYSVPVSVRAEPLESERLPPETEVVLFRIAQEALNNTGKYADAEHVEVSLGLQEGSVKLVVKDDGIGFDPRSIGGPTRNGGLGLYGMRERAELIGGCFDLRSTPRSGTTVTVVAPLDGNKNVLPGSEDPEPLEAR